METIINNRDHLKQHFQDNANIRLLALAPDEIEAFLDYLEKFLNGLDSYLMDGNYDSWWFEEAVNRFLGH